MKIILISNTYIIILTILLHKDQNQLCARIWIMVVTIAKQYIGLTNYGNSFLEYIRTQ